MLMVEEDCRLNQQEVQILLRGVNGPVDLADSAESYQL
jgi:hypothetical protein